MKKLHLELEFAMSERPGWPERYNHTHDENILTMQAAQESLLISRALSDQQRILAE